MNSKVQAGVIALSLGLAACVGGEDNSEHYGLVSQALQNGREFAPGQVIVQYVAGAEEGDKVRARGRVGSTAAETIRASADEGDLELVHLPPGRAVAEAVGALADEAVVEFAEPNWVYTHQATTPSDASFANLWGLNNVGQPVGANAGGKPDADIDAPEAWDLGTGSNTVYVGVIDEGIDYNHVDLQGAVGNPGEVLDGVDNDGNGYVDDVHGWDFANGDRTVFDSKRTQDGLDTHGTHVAGTIGARGNNGIGVVGVAWNVRIISGKFLGKRGGTTANAIKAFDYFTDLRKNRGVNVVATNNSWGGGGYSSSLSAAIGRATAAGIVTVIAAGNSSQDINVTPSYPASYTDPGIIAVAATDRFDALASYSNYGATSVDVGAPGSLILSTLPFNTYGYYNGTSMATPHVTGLVALLSAYDPVLTAADLKTRILSTVVPIPALAGKTLTGGRINAYKALSNLGIDP
jgi:subtilisin family serine protease